MNQRHRASSHGTAATDAAAWKQRVIGHEADPDRPASEWMEASHAAFASSVLNRDYPCYFGSYAERRGELFYGFVEELRSDRLVHLVRHFVDLRREPHFRRFNLAVFYEPSLCEADLESFQRFAWGELQGLIDANDAGDDPGVCPDDPAWELTFGAQQMFVVAASPTHCQRRSRNLGPGAVLLFQPRDVFYDKDTGEPISWKARLEIRERLRRWDAVDPHLDLGVYGDANNREWKQYVLSDDNRAQDGQCPLRIKL